MRAQAPEKRLDDAGVGVGGWLFGFGLITLALFPFLIPGLALIAVIALPLLLIPLAGALLIALLAAPPLIVWRLTRRGGPGRRRGEARAASQPASSMRTPTAAKG